MKFITPFFIVAVTWLQTSALHSQDLQIQRGNKTKTFKTGHLIRIDKPNLIYPECKSCPNEYMIGRLESFHHDTLNMRLKIHSISAAENGKEIGTKGIVYKKTAEKEWPIVKIPSSLVLGITKQGKKTGSLIMRVN
jgi:hypothetical protein